MKPPLLINAAERWSGQWRHLKWLAKATNWPTAEAGTDISKVDGPIVIGGHERAISDAMCRLPVPRWKNVVAMLCTGATKFGRTPSWRLARCGAVLVPTEWARQMAAAGNSVMNAEVLWPLLPEEADNPEIHGEQRSTMCFGIYAGVPGRSEASKQAEAASRTFGEAFRGESKVKFRVLSGRPRQLACGPPIAECQSGFGMEADARRIAWYDGLDGFFSVSTGEGFDFCAAEALARGLPIAGTPHWGGTGQVGPTVPVPYTLEYMHKRIGHGLFMDNSVGAFISDRDMVEGWRQLRAVAELRRGTKVVDTAGQVYRIHYIATLSKVVERVAS